MYLQMGIRFDWDLAKNRTNKKKHGIDFGTAKLVFDDPNVITFPERNIEGEQRWQAIGIADGIVILAVAHTIRYADGDELIRIISARKASRREREEYEH